MIIYGVNPVLEAIRSHRQRIHYVAVAKGAHTNRVFDAAKEAGVPVRILPSEQIDRAAGGGVHNGVIADVSEASYASFEEIVERDSTNFVLILDGITDPQNFGAILRVAEGFGVHLIVIPQHESVGLTPAAVKASAGASEWVPIAQVTNLARTIEALKKRDYWIYGASANGEPPSAIDFTGKVALVLGSEGKGIRRNVLEHCDRVVTIPMSGRVASFNVATAAAVLCYEVRRQQSAKPQE
ncbi:MAG TPA: 23S rRNA (guanosine(2251)-2'-O)-methyltransferase RlmB [Thermoanaerobaculia bacterium]|nr:23S rRNA (guanosine(2251)-2'-O)-methyltransferase RlmB [Thermoanaerobaculia bacterium]